MRLSDEKYELLKGELVYYFELYKVCHVPINGFDIACKMGIQLIQYSSIPDRIRQEIKKFSDDSFLLELVNGSEFIFFNDSVQPERINMSILHEIAHCVLDHKGEPAKAEEEEAEADFWAKYAFAPPPLIHRIAPKSWRDIKRVFCNSEEAAKNSYNYYQKWLSGFIAYGYTEYEMRLLRLFGVAPEKERNSPMVA